MKNGIYHVTFSTKLGHGEGFVVVGNNLINGGDQGYVFRGKVSDAGKNFAGEIHIQRWNAMHNSVFGPVESMKLNLEGIFDEADNSFAANGTQVGLLAINISIKGRFLSDLAEG